MMREMVFSWSSHERNALIPTQSPFLGSQRSSSLGFLIIIEPFFTTTSCWHYVRV